MITLSVVALVGALLAVALIVTLFLAACSLAGEADAGHIDPRELTDAVARERRRAENGGEPW